MPGPSADTLESLLSARQDCLRALVDRPHSKRDLVERLDCSASTVERALKSLADAYLVEYTYAETDWQITFVGRCAIEEYDAYAGQLRDLAAATPILAALPLDSPIGPAFIDGSKAYETAPVVPDAIIQHMLDSARKATQIRALVPRALASVSLEFYTAAMTGDASEFECVLDPDVFERLRDIYPTETDNAMSNGRVSLYSAPIPLAFGLWIADHQEAGVVVYDENGIRGILINREEEAIDWAYDHYTTAKSDAESVLPPEEASSSSEE